MPLKKGQVIGEQERDEENRPLKKDGTLDKRFNRNNAPGEDGRIGRPRGEQPAVRIDYKVDEEGISPQLRAFRYVCQYRRENEDGAEDSLVAALRKVRIENPQKFVDDWERLENDWKRQKGEALALKATDTPLELDRASEKCLEAIDLFLKRCRAEAEEAGQKEREALRGLKNG